MKYQRGIALSGLIFWGAILVVVAVFGMKIVPTAIDYFKMEKDIKAVVAQAAPEATVADLRKAFDKYAEVDQLEFRGADLEIYKDNGKVVIEFDYEKRIPLFANVSLLIEYKGSTAD